MSAKKRREYLREWQRHNRDKTAAYSRKHRYGITQEQYDRMYKKQGGRCVICRRKVRLVVDHNHKTDKVRGLLCHHCNSDLCRLEDALWMSRAMSYLEET